MKFLKHATKAFVAGFGAAGSGLIVAAEDSSVTGGEWWRILGLGLVMFGAVYAAPNR